MANLQQKKLNNYENNVNTALSAKLNIQQGNKSKLIRDIFGLEDDADKQESKKININDINKNIFFSKDDFKDKETKVPEVIGKMDLNEPTSLKPVYKLKKLPKKNTSTSSFKDEKSQTSSPYQGFFGSINENKAFKFVPQEKQPLDPNRDSSLKLNKNTSSSTFTNTAKSDLLDDKKANNYDYIPCVNCNNMVHINDIEKHTDICNKVVEEVKKVEDSKFSYHVVDFKLKKLAEHVVSMQKNTPYEINKEAHIIEIISNTIKETIQTAKISSSSLIALKKFIVNLDVSHNLYFRL